MARPHISTNDLKKMARVHISYEIQMLLASIAELKEGNQNQVKINAGLESFVIHARCLFDFLYPSKNIRKSDAIADDFFEDSTYFRTALPSFLPATELLNFRAGKEVAHLTYDRLKVTREKKGWNIGEIHDQLTDALAIFFECLADEQRSWFNPSIRKDSIQLPK